MVQKKFRLHTRTGGQINMQLIISHKAGVENQGDDCLNQRYPTKICKGPII